MPKEAGPKALFQDQEQADRRQDTQSKEEAREANSMPNKDQATLFQDQEKAERSQKTVIEEPEKAKDVQKPKTIM